MRVCGNCKEKGHNKRTCVKSVVTQSVLTVGNKREKDIGKTKRKLRVRYVEAGQKCLECLKNFYPIKPLSGRINERYCSGECAWLAMTKKEKVNDQV